MSPNRDKHLHATIDRLLASHGNYQPLELLLALGRLPYPRYEAWRRGELEALEDGLAGNRERIVQGLEAAAKWAEKLGLKAHEERYHAWGGEGELRLFHDPGSDRLARTHYRRAAEAAPQLDLFFDGGATAALNDLRDALARRDAGAAERARADLARAEPDHRQLPAAEALLDALAHLDAPVLAPAAELEAVHAQLRPRAEGLLGARARDYLAPFWRRLAAALPPERFDPAHDRLHPSWVAAQYLDWPAVAAAAQAVPDYEAHPVLLTRLADARHLAGEEVPALAAACRLCWCQPRAAEAWLPGAADPSLAAAREGFWDLEPGLEVVWFPAWLLIGAPGLVHHLPADLGADQHAPGRTFAVVHRLASAPDDAGLRAELRALEPGLFQAWLDTLKPAPTRSG